MRHTTDGEKCKRYEALQDDFGQRVLKPIRYPVGWQMKKVALISTGGTIASMEDNDAMLKPTLKSNDLVKALSSVPSLPEISTFDFSNVPSHWFDFNTMLDLSRTVEKVIATENPDGVVITMGTDAMEEIAYFLELVLKRGTPVIVTGAMRSPVSLTSDGSVNLHNALLAASSTSLRNQGVVVLMNSEIHHARYVTKTNTMKLSAFSSPDVGPIGVLRENQVVLYAGVPLSENFVPRDMNLRVDLIKFAVGMDGSLVDAAISLGAKGVVIEGYGGGHVTPASIPALEKAVDQGIPIVMTSRCLSGELYHNTYGTAGSEIHLRRLGVIYGSGIPGIKARIKLALALGSRMTLEQIRQSFEGWLPKGIP